jgi:hypothetical protein
VIQEYGAADLNPMENILGSTKLVELVRGLIYDLTFGFLQ